ncbi:MAG TPA: hypothetical protein VFI45_03320 [Candidatus Acidoferrum sp.]|nr:hypothetical protein [Candidatus Acidoferrum sp.]
MIGLMPIVFLGTLILVFCGRLLLQWTKNKHEQPVTIEDFSRARAVLDSMSLEAMATRKIFAIDDMEFIVRGGTLAIQRFFVKERRSLAVRWLRIIQKQVAQLMDVHLKLASYTLEPSPSFELRLTVNYLWFVVVSNALLMLVWLRGPFKAARIVGYTLDVAEYFCCVFNTRLDKTDAVKLGVAALPRRV